MSDSPLFWLVLVLKIYRCPSNVFRMNVRIFICCTCYFQSSSPFFVYFGFLCLQDCSVSNFPLTQGGKGGHLLRFSSSVVLWGGRDTAKQILLACVGSARSGWTTLGLPQPKAACASWVHTAQFPQCSARALSQVDPAFHALFSCKSLRFLGALQGHRLGWAVLLVPFPGPSNSGD